MLLWNSIDVFLEHSENSHDHFVRISTSIRGHSHQNVQYAAQVLHRKSSILHGPLQLTEESTMQFTVHRVLVDVCYFGVDLEEFYQVTVL